MFKKLDKLIVKAFIGPFIATFFITLLVLVMQFFWLYIDDFVGKGLGVDVVLKFIWYQSAVLIPLALPLAVLLSSLMTFGSLGESFELVAIKSSGISLLRFMRPLFIISIFISGIAFLFSNYVIPVAYLKSRTLLSDIVYAKPAFAINEGVFYDRINGFAIKIGTKEPNDSIIRDVIVYEQGNNLQDNFIIAKSGVMKASDDKRYLEFNLKDGWRYQDGGKDANASGQSDYIRLRFKEYKKQLDLSAFLFMQTPDSVNKNNERVYSIRQLNIAIDSIKKENGKIRNLLQGPLYASLTFTKQYDSTNVKQVKAPVVADSVRHRRDSIRQKREDSLFLAAKSLNDLLPDSASNVVFQQAVGEASSMKISLTSTQTSLKEKERILRKHKIEWHRKIVLSLSCLVLFLIGAPLGSIIRKGGLGTPLIAAISFFMLFYFSTTMGEKLAKENTLTPFTGMWLAIFILMPISVFITYKAMRDSQLFNKEWYHRTAKSIAAFAGRFSRRSN